MTLERDGGILLVLQPRCILSRVLRRRLNDSRKVDEIFVGLYYSAIFTRKRTHLERLYSGMYSTFQEYFRIA
jgi:hypothetical protein